MLIFKFLLLIKVCVRLLLIHSTVREHLESHQYTGAEIVNDFKHRKKVKTKENRWKKQQEIREIDNRISGYERTINERNVRLQRIGKKEGYVEEIAYLKADIVKLQEKITPLKIAKQKLENE